MVYNYGEKELSGTLIKTERMIFMSYGPRGPSGILPNGGDHTRDNRDGSIHESIYDRDRGERISWDHDRDGNYIPGSGHTANQDDSRDIPNRYWDR
ncbi:MAG: hypothetical protein PHN66_01845 [Candidatus Shapirobacteria bacterium]|nr:hypothetical protein [Candidatus Shapirobacteria bacterium]